MSDCKTCEYLDRFNCCCSNEPMMTCKAEMEEHDAKVRADAIDECIGLLKNEHYKFGKVTFSQAIDVLEKLKEQNKNG